mmetsp:Transcript_86777/g.167001  ORF Transcript_86777/g.167001 Transcript_86777/m.167001 type:complete len:232 (+) Transcript_86777:873-1568(+)
MSGATRLLVAISKEWAAILHDSQSSTSKRPASLHLPASILAKIIGLLRNRVTDKSESLVFMKPGSSIKANHELSSEMPMTRDSRVFSPRTLEPRCFSALTKTFPGCTTSHSRLRAVSLDPALMINACAEDRCSLSSTVAMLLLLLLLPRAAHKATGSTTTVARMPEASTTLRVNRGTLCWVLGAAAGPTAATEPSSASQSSPSLLSADIGPPNQQPTLLAGSRAAAAAAAA